MIEIIAPTATSTTPMEERKMDVLQSDLFFDSIDVDAIRQSRDQVCVMVARATAGLSRDRIADSMTDLGCTTSKAMIDAWASPSHTGHNLPFYLVAAFETSCRTTQLTDWLVNLRGGLACYGEEALRREVAAELAALEVERSEFTRRITALRNKMRNI
ncbi:MAG: hypothetical protein R3E64_04225 [Halioglobus sp.]